MKISVIVCTRNRSHAIVPCLDSIARALETASPIEAEILVVNNASTDDTELVISNWLKKCPFPVRALYEEKKGVSAARNLGLRTALGELLLLIDDDCRMDRNHVVDALRHDSADAVPVLRGGRVELGDATDLPLTIKIDSVASRWSLEKKSARRENLVNTILGCNTAMRRTIVEKLGFFDERLGTGTNIPGGEDIDYVFRAYLAGIPIEYVPDMAVFHFHGRKKLSNALKLVRGYMIGAGALYAKYAFKDLNLIRPLIWDFKNTIRDLFSKPTSCFSGVDFYHADKVIYSMVGIIRYTFGAQTPPSISASYIKETSMKLSVIICTRNRSNAIIGCLQAVSEAMTHAGPLAAEIVIVNNNSTDNTAAVLQEWTKSCVFPVQVLFEKRKGVSFARNLGMRTARGQLLIFIDDDCRMDKNYIIDALRHDAADTKPILRGGRVELGDPTDLPLTIKTNRAAAQWSREKNSARSENLGDTFYGCNMVMSKAVAEIIGPFDERLGVGSNIPGGEDIDYVLRAYLADLEIQYVPDMSVFHHHGRKNAADGTKLMKNYMIGSGALYAKYMFKDFNLCRPFIWDARNAIREVLSGTNSYFPSFSFSHIDKVMYSLLGFFKYLDGFLPKLQMSKSSR